jgi:hypothetical protein
VEDADERVGFVERTVSIRLNGGEDKLVNSELWQNMCCQYHGIHGRRSAQYSRYLVDLFNFLSLYVFA